MKKSTISYLIEKLSDQVKDLEESNKSLRDYNDNLCNQGYDLGVKVRDLTSKLSASEDSRVSLAQLEALIVAPTCRIDGIKTIRYITGCGLKEAKQFHDTCLYEPYNCRIKNSYPPAKDLGEVIASAMDESNDYV